MKTVSKSPKPSRSAYLDTTAAHYRPEPEFVAYDARIYVNGWAILGWLLRWLSIISRPLGLVCFVYWRTQDPYATVAAALLFVVGAGYFIRFYTH